MAFTDTLTFIRLQHVGQTRSDGVTPYFDHILEVLKRTERRIVRGIIPEPLATHYREVSGCHDLLEQCPGLEAEDLPISPEARKSVILLTRLPDMSLNRYISGILTDQIAIRSKIDDILANLGDDPSFKQTVRYSKMLVKLFDALRNLIHVDPNDFDYPVGVTCAECGTGYPIDPVLEENLDYNKGLNRLIEHCPHCGYVEALRSDYVEALKVKGT